MGVFSEIAMEQQNSMFDSSAAFEDDEAFELEEMESLPVPPVGTDTVPVSAASVSAGETALADAEEEPTDEVAPAGEEKSAEEGNSAQPPAAEDEEKKRAEHEAAEAQRKAEFDAKQQAKKAAEQEQIARLEAMSDEEVIAASTQRVSTDVEKLTRRNMKECVSDADARGTQSYTGCRFADTQQVHPGTLYVGLFAELLHGECFAIIFGYHSQASGTAVHTVQLFIERKFAHNRFFCFTLRVSRFVSLPQVTHSGIVQSIRISLLGLSVR